MGVPWDIASKISRTYALFCGLAGVDPDDFDENDDVSSVSLSVDSGRPDSVVSRESVGNLSLPSGAKLHEVLVIPADGLTVTVTVPGGSAITPPSDLPFSADFKGGIVGGGSTNVVIAGNVAYAQITYEAA